MVAFIRFKTGCEKLLNKLIPLTDRPPFLAAGPINVGRESLVGLLQRLFAGLARSPFILGIVRFAYVGLKGVIATGGAHPLRWLLGLKYIIKY